MLPAPHANVKFILIEGHEVMKDGGAGGDYAFSSPNLDKLPLPVASFLRNPSPCY